MCMDKNVLITGANGGIGRKLIEAFAKEKYHILANLRVENKEFLSFADVVSETYQTTIEPIYFDVTDEQAVKAAVKALRAQRKYVDVLVNNAGVAHGGLLQMTPISTIREIFDVNFFGTVTMCQCVSQYMRKNGGTIINIASVAGLDLAAGNCAYGTSKAAVIALTKTLAKELAVQNIRVNAVAPGLTDTNMAKSMEESAGEDMIMQTAFKRLAKPEEIADAVVYLSSDKASFITGQVLRVDGGM